MIKNVFENVRKKSPIVHNITNYVTVNDCANVILASGASPIMADEALEVEEIVAISSALNINIGTLNKNTIDAMLLAGKEANKRDIPVVLDPVGVGASTLRTDTALKLIENIKFSVIRGNSSEIKTLVLGTDSGSGVDASEMDKINKENIGDVIDYAKEYSIKTGAIIVITGETDIVVDGKKTALIKNGDTFMSSITGTGCQLSALIASFIGANEQNMFFATVSAVCTLGLCGELAKERMTKKDGNASFRTYMIDEVYNMTGNKLVEGAKYEVY